MFSLRTAMMGGVAACAVLAATPALAQVQSFDIAAQSARTAIPEFGRQSGIQILASQSDVGNQKVPALKGEYEPREALAMLLAATNLKIASDDGRTVTLVQAPQGGSAGGGADQGNAVEALIVTAQKKEEAIQDVPIAISAFTQKSLDAQKIEGGFDLLKAIPNVTFSKNNFTGYNFSIRGIGTKAISATTDPGVSVSFNNTGLIVNRLFEQEYFDVERVEVLRGPQGTLYGRNATSGVINVISAKPRMGEFDAELKAEAGNYNARRLRGMINIPLGDQLAVRVAGAITKRDGYGLNLHDNSDVDDRNLWSLRTTLGWEPTDTFRANLLWERFKEDDGRVRTSKQLCHRDPGPEFVGDFRVAEHNHPVFRLGAEVSLGCKPGSLYDKGSAAAQADPFAPGLDHGAFGTPNGTSLPAIFGGFIASAFSGGYGLRPDANFGIPGSGECDVLTSDPRGDWMLVFMFNVCKPDPYGGRGQSRDLRTIESQIQPIYRATADIFELSWDWDITEGLSLMSQTVYNEDEIYSTQDFNRFHTLPGTFSDTAAACGSFFWLFGGDCEPGTWAGGIFADLAPGGVYTDPQLGPSDTIVGQDISRGGSTQFSQEFRLASSWDGPVNFSLGANYTKFKVEIDYFVLFNVFSYIAEGTSLYNHAAAPNGFPSSCADDGIRCVYVDPNPLESIDGDGHNYFRSKNPYELDSRAIFGEIYWEIAPAVKLTAGLRYTWDEKIFTPYPSQLLLYDYREITFPGTTDPYLPPGSPPEACADELNDASFGCPQAGNAPGGKGFIANPTIVQTWDEPTGRLVIDWKPDLGFTDESMIYASYSHGYKGGGANPPSVAPPSGLYIAAAAGAAARPTFDPEYVDAFELGTKNTLLDGGLVLNATVFKYFYEGYQVSKIVDRSAANENFDAEIWGSELEWVFSPSRNLRFNGAFGYLSTEIAEGERSIDLMNRAQGGLHSSYIDINGVEHQLAYDEWVVVKPWITGTSNCVVPVDLVERLYEDERPVVGQLCAGGGIIGNSFVPGAQTIPGAGPQHFDPLTEAPNAGAGFFQELGGNELPNAPHWTASLGAQYSLGLPGGWEATLRGDFYYQSQSFHRVYNTQYDKLRAWTNTNISLWFEHEGWGVTAEVYVKNVFDEMPITDAFLNSDDAALTTNVFTLDPRLIGVSVTKSF